MPGLKNDDAVKVVIKLRKYIEEINTLHTRSSIGTYVTVSVGVTSIIQDENIGHHKFQAYTK